MGYPKLLPSIIACKCPRCRTGRVFEAPLWQLSKLSKTNEFCPHCHLKFEPEVGFYWGAMYVNYALSTGLMIMTGIIFVNYDWLFNYIFLIVPVVALIFLPFGYRYSRIVMLYFITPKTHRFDKKLV